MRNYTRKQGMKTPEKFRRAEPGDGKLAAEHPLVIGMRPLAVASGKLPYAATDTHWSAEGHAIVAAELADVLRERTR